jgi:hypothetical protein
VARTGMSAKVQNLAKKNSTATALTAKVAIRRNVLSAIGADQARVFDAYAGDGQMHKAVWREASDCVGCDLEFYPDERLAFVADNLRVLRAIDLDGFNLFDLDSYGSPWEQLYIIAARRKLQPGETIGLVLTEGQGLKLKMGGMSAALALLAGVSMRMPGLGTAQNELIDRAIRRIATIMGGAVVRRWQANGKTGSTMRYIGLVLASNPN